MDTFAKDMRPFAVILMYLLPCALFSQEPRFVNYSSADALPSNTVYAITQDAGGTLWIGTRNGLSSFDGTRFLSWKEYGRVNALCVDNGGRLWIGSSNGVRVRCPVGEGHDAIIIDSSAPGSPLSGRHVRALCKDRDGAIWAATKDSLLVRQNVEGGTIVQDRAFRYLIGDFEGDYPVQRLFPDPKGRLWLGGRMVPLQILKDSASESDPKFLKGPWNTGSFALHGGQIWAFDDYISCLLSFDESRQDFDNAGRLPIAHADLLSDREGRLWAGGCYGLCLVDTENPSQSVLYKHQAGVPSSLASTELYCIFEDSRGNLWVGGNNGLSVLSPHMQLIQSPNLPSKQITSLMQASDGSLWVGTADDGAYVLGDLGSEGDMTHLDYRPSGRPNEGHVSCLYEDRGGAVYIGLYAGCGFNIWENGHLRRGFISGPIPEGQHVVASGDRITSNWITDFLEDGNGRFWVVSWEGVGLNEWDRRTGKTLPVGWLSPFKYPSPGKDSTIYLSSRLGSRLIEDAHGNLVYGTTEAGVSVIDATTGLVTKYNKGNSSIPDDYVTDLCLEKGGAVWVATHGGLWKMPEEDVRDTMRAPVLLGGMLVQSVLSDDKGRLWAGTQDGLYFIDTDGSVGRVPRQLGFPSDIFGERTACKLRDGRLAFGGPEGMAIFHPDSLLAIGGVSGDLLLSPLLQHRHRISGGEWVPGPFLGLPDSILPGRYSIEEQSSDIFGRWDRGERTLQEVRVPLPLWLRWPFLLGYVILLTALVYLIMKLRERHLLKRELDMRNRLFAIISHDLRGPISGNRMLARELREHVDNLSREQLREGLEELSLSADNASSLLENLLLWSLSQKGMLEPVMREENLLCLAREAVESVRGEDVITVDIPDHLTVRTDRNMLLTILRNLLDNAIKASCTSAPKGPSVILRSTARKGSLPVRQILIIDNGPGLKEDSSPRGHGLGLVITRELLDKMGGSLQMRNREEGGLEITITL